MLYQTPPHNNRKLTLPIAKHFYLEIGCGSGGTGKLYLRRNPRARYIGLEISQDYGAIARQHITECFVGNIETIDILTLTGGDCTRLYCI